MRIGRRSRANENDNLSSLEFRGSYGVCIEKSFKKYVKAFMVHDLWFMVNDWLAW